MWNFARQLVKQAEDIIAPENEPQGPSYGFRVLHVAEDSLSRKAGIESLFDFVVAVNYQPLSAPVSRQQFPGTASAPDSETAPIEKFESLLHAGETAVLTVWSAKGKVVRNIELPVSKHGASSGLGMTLQWTSLSVADHVWHILNVSAGSPAEEAGLISHSDYIVGAENGLLEQGGESLLARVISRVASDPSREAGVILYVYNHDYDTLRPVRIVPRVDKHGQPVLGCGVAYGLLHGLPLADTRQGFAPGSTLYDADVPATGDTELVSAGAAAPLPGQVPAPVPVLAPIPEPPRDHASATATPSAPPAGPAPGSASEPTHGPAAGPAPGPAPGPASSPAKAKGSKKPHSGGVDPSGYFDEQTALSHELDGWKPKPESGASAPPPSAPPKSG